MASTTVRLTLARAEVAATRSALDLWSPVGLVDVQYAPTTRPTTPHVSPAANNLGPAFATSPSTSDHH